MKPVGVVVQNLTACSSTSKSSPSNVSKDSSTTSETLFAQGENKTCHRRSTSRQSLLTRNLLSSAGEDDISHVSSLTSSFLHEISGNEKIGTPKGMILMQALIPKDEFTCQQKELGRKGKKVFCKELNGSDDALIQFQSQLCSKNAEIRYLTALIAELKLLYGNRLEVMDMELVALRKQLQETRQELSRTKQDLSNVMDEQAQITADRAKENRELLVFSRSEENTIQSEGRLVEIGMPPKKLFIVYKWSNH